MAPAWFREERRQNPTPEDTASLFLFNLREMARRSDEDRKEIAKNTAAIREVNKKLDHVVEHMGNHDQASREMLETFKMARALHKFILWFVGLFVGAVAFFFQGHELWVHLRGLFTTKP